MKCNICGEPAGWVCATCGMILCEKCKADHKEECGEPDMEPIVEHRNTWSRDTRLYGHSIKNPHMRHFVVVQDGKKKYLCNQASGITPIKTTEVLDRVNCENCLRLLRCNHRDTTKQCDYRSFGWCLWHTIEGARNRECPVDVKSCQELE